MMKPYAVEISFTMIVMADDDGDAHRVARNNANEAWGDTADKDLSVIGPVRSMEELCRHDWDGQCIPYGGDGNTRLSDILANLEPEPERDTQTIDMFAESA